MPTGHSYYARATSISPAYYEALLNRCWRRSGNLLYRPNQRADCCPHYAIRLDSSHFRPTKDQRQTINRFNKYVIGEEYAKEAARVYPKSREQVRRRDTEFDLVERIHECEETSLKQPPRLSHSFTVTLETIEFTEEKYRVYENYQRVVHHETPSEIGRESFKRFLCTSPLTAGKFMDQDGRERQLGSFHQCYRLDSELVAIGVIDLLPHCVSAVYFLYHESVHKHSPGKLGALREIALAAEQGYRWWYSGYYIHTCPKMRYKVDYSPTYILDPDSYAWLSLDDNMLAKFNEHGYLDLSPAGGADSPNSPQPESTPNAKKGEANPEPVAEDDVESLFTSGMPGMLSSGQLSSFNLDHVVTRISRGYCYAGDLFRWQDESTYDPSTPKSVISGLVALIGPDLMEKTCLDFRRPG